MKKLILILLCISFINTNAQECGNVNSDEPLLLLSSDCDNRNNYSPYDPVITPVIYVRVAFHILQDENGEGNFQDIPVHTSFLIDMFNDINFRYANLESVSPGTSNFISHSRIQFFIEDIYYYQDTEDWDWSSTNCASYYTSQGPCRDKCEYVYNKYYPTFNSTIQNQTLNIFLGENHATVQGEASWFGDKKWVYVRGMYYAYLNEPTYEDAINKCGATLAHEFGHSLGLKHNFYDPPGPNSLGLQSDDCCDNDETPCNPALIGTSNNMMDYSLFATDALSECQLSKMHYYLMGKSGNISLTVPTYYYCNKGGADIIIDEDGEDIIWQSEKFIINDIIIESGTTLTIKCKVYLPNEGKIIVKQGAKLIIDGGHLTNICSNFWQGIEVWGNGSYTAHPSKIDIITGAYPSSAAHHGVVWIKNGGTIEFARNAITTSKYDDFSNQNYYGGIVIVGSSTFRNCRRSVEFMKYDYYPYDADDDNISEFKNCTFIIDDEYPASEAFAYHFSLWDVDGVLFTDNVYKDLRTSSAYTAEAIYSIDATYTVNSVLCSPPPPNTCIGDYNYFEGFLRGVHAANAFYRPLNIEINTGVFEDNTRGVLLSNVKNSVIINNTFRIQDNVVNSYGLYLEDCENYHVENNYFTSLSGFDGVFPYNAGIYSVNNSNAHTLIYRNTFEDLEAAIRCQVNNKNLQIKCNTFLSEINRYHVYATSGLLGNQGKCLSTGTTAEKVQAPAGNIFTHDCNYTEGDFKIHTGIPELKYRHHTGLAYTPQCYTTPNIVPQDCGLSANEGGYVACTSTLPGSGEELIGGGSSASDLLTEFYSTEEIISELEELIDAAESEEEENDDLLYFAARKEQLTNKIVSSYIVELKPDSAIWFLEQQETDAAKETIVQIYLTVQDYTAAESALKNVNSVTTEGTDFISLYEVLIPLAEEERTILQLGKKELSIIESLAGKQSASGVAAENILQFINQTDYPEVFDAEMPEDLRLLQQENSIPAIQMFPNPANKTLTISIAQFDAEKDYLFKAWAMNGTLIAEIKLIKDHDNMIPISTWSSGIYLCEVSSDGEVLFTDKLMKE